MSDCNAMTEEQRRKQLAQQFANAVNNLLAVWESVGLNRESVGKAELEFVTKDVRFQLEAKYEQIARTFSIKVTKADRAMVAASERGECGTCGYAPCACDQQ